MPLGTLGYCFGGSSALEHLRTGGRVRGVVSVHAGLGLLDFDWPGARGDAQVLVSTGASDPMASADQRTEIQRAMTRAGIDWEVALFSDTKHAFTSPHAGTSGMPDEVVGYQPRNARRAWEDTTRFLREALPGISPVSV